MIKGFEDLIDLTPAAFEDLIDLMPTAFEDLILREEFSNFQITNHRSPLYYL